MLHLGGQKPGLQSALFGSVGRKLLAGPSRKYACSVLYILYPLTFLSYSDSSLMFSDSDKSRLKILNLRVVLDTRM